MSKQNTNILGKSSTDKDGNNITLFRHTKDVQDAFGELQKNLNGRVLSENLRKIIQLTIFFHDLGKVLPSFQIKSLENKEYEPFDVEHILPHSLFSLFWIDRQKLEAKVEQLVGSEQKEQYVQWIISAVAYHHWRESFPDFLQRNNRTIHELCKKVQNEWGEQLKNNLKEEFKESKVSDFDTTLIGINERLVIGLMNGLGLSDYATPPYYLYWLPKRIIDQDKQLEWILISGFTMLSDHFASYCEEEGDALAKIEIPNINAESIKKRISDEIKSKLGHENFDLWQAREVKDYKDKNTVLIAPTGYGKTEFSFLWSNGEKFFYTLPLRTAVDQIYQRASKIFNDGEEEGAGRTGILHSDADVFLLGDGGERDNIKLYDLARQLAFPVNISTGDQFFPYALRPPGYEKIYAKFSYSRLVIDEVQAYDPKAAAIIVKFLEDVVRLGGKFLLMTATFPKFIREAINQRVQQFDEDFNILDSYMNTLNLYENDKENLVELQKHRIQLTLIDNSEKDFLLPAEKLDKIIASAKDKRVLVIVNTIKQAQSVWSDLIQKGKQKDYPVDRIDLLHSRFTKQDRNRKEKEIEKNFSNRKPDDEKEGRILVSTQIVEASLDIDADVLFTELSPIDNLVQRMGRVLRRYRSGFKYEESEANIIIWTFQNGLDSGKGYVYHKELQLATLKILNSKLHGKNIGSDKVKDWIEKYKGDFQLTNNEDGNEKEIIINESVGPYLLSDYEKYDLVEHLYNSIPEKGGYLKEFYQTMDILDAGYMSDRKSEAHKIFREIYNAEVIPEERIEEFKDDVETFFKNNQLDQNFLYAKFKKHVLSKFTLQVPLYKVEGELYESNLALNQLDVRDASIKEKQKQKLKRWLNGIYAVNIRYNEEGASYKSVEFIM